MGVRAAASKLRNGLSVVSDTSRGPLSAVGLLVRSGSRFESKGNAGSSHVLDKLFSLEMASHIEEMGGSFMSSPAKDCTLYSCALSPSKIDSALSVLSRLFEPPRITQEMVDDVCEAVEYEKDEREKKFDELMPDLCQQVAWNGRAYGRNLFTLHKEIRNLRAESVEQFWKWRFRPQMSIIGGAGVDHQVLVEKAKQLLDKEANSGEFANLENTIEKAEYSGGVMFVPEPTADLFHCAIGFQGMKLSDDDAFPLAVLQILLGGGSAFSAGGPGKGMYSRLYTNILNRFHWVESAKAFNTLYREDGLFGIFGSSLESHQRSLIQVEFDSEMTPIELNRARNQTKSTLLMGLESRLLQVEDMTRQLQCLGRKLDGQEIVDRIEAVKKADLVRVRDKMLSSFMSFAAFGRFREDAVSAELRNMTRLGIKVKFE